MLECRVIIYLLTQYYYCLLHILQQLEIYFSVVDELLKLFTSPLAAWGYIYVLSVNLREPGPHTCTTLLFHHPAA